MYENALDREYAQAKIDHATAIREYRQARDRYTASPNVQTLTALKAADQERMSKMHRVLDYQARYRKIGVPLPEEVD